jgi:hypothetical protein
MDRHPARTFGYYAGNSHDIINDILASDSDAGRLNNRSWLLDCWLRSRSAKKVAAAEEKYSEDSERETCG